MWIVRLCHGEYSYVDYAFDDYDDATKFAKVAMEHFVIKSDSYIMRAILIRKMNKVMNHSDEEFVKDEPPFDVVGSEVEA